MYRSFGASPLAAAAAALAIMLLLPLAACTRAEQKKAEPPPASGLEMRAIPETREATQAAPAAGSNGKAQKPAVLKPVAPATIASARAFGLAAPPGPFLPADFSLGPLADLAPKDKEELALLEPALAFLSALREGRLEAERVLPERRDILASLLSPLFAAPRPRAFRLGSFLREGDAALARLRLEAAPPEGVGPLSRPPRAEGELRLRREEGVWYVEDLALDPAGLSREPPPSDGAFEPGFAAP